MEDKRYLLIILGSSQGIDQDLNYIANGETGVNFVDGNSIFMATFYSVLTVDEINSELSHRPAFLLFDITEKDTNIVNLPTKYYYGLFPEVREVSEQLVDQKKAYKNMVNNEKPTNNEEFTTVNDILDKLSRNNYDRGCLTENELKILSESSK